MGKPEASRAIGFAFAMLNDGVLPYGQTEKALRENPSWHPQHPPVLFLYMRTVKVVLGLWGMMLAVINCEAQSQGTRFLMSISGSCLSNAPSGYLGVRYFNTQSMLKDFAAAGGIANPNSLALIYHLGSDVRGDSIEVVNAGTGQLLDTPFLLYFGDDQSLGRMALTNSFHTQVAKIHYVYTDQNSHSMGSCLLRERFSYNRSGQLTNGLITGTMTWIITPDGHQPMQVLNAAITTTRILR